MMKDMRKGHIRNLRRLQIPDMAIHHISLMLRKMCQAVSIGYDWLYDYLTEERRAVLENAMIKFGMKEYLRRYTTKEWWSDTDSNWASICNSGAIMLSMALMDKYPDESSAMIEIAIKGLENCLYGFGPDGAWYEGPGYWSATIEGLGLGLQTLKSTINKEYGLATSSGFSTTADWASSIAYGDQSLCLSRCCIDNRFADFSQRFNVDG